MHSFAVDVSFGCLVRLSRSAVPLAGRDADRGFILAVTCGAVEEEQPRAARAVASTPPDVALAGAPATIVA